MKEKYNVGGMTCSACSAHVEKSVKKLNGVSNVNVNLLQNNMTVEYDENILNKNDIIEAVEKGGYTATLPTNTNKTSALAKEQGVDPAVLELKEMKKRLIISVIFMIPLMYVSMGHMINLPLPSFLEGPKNSVGFALTQMLLVLPVMYINRKFYQTGFKSLFNGAPNMDSLIAIGSGAAFAYGVFAIYRMGYGLGVQDFALVHRYHSDLYFESASMILTLITAGKFLEARAKGRTSDAIRKLMDLSPKTAIVERNNMEYEIPVEEVELNDIVIVKPGAHIPVDGEIIEGNTSIDEAALTGESIPVEKKIGDKVLSATINKNGHIKFRATKIGDDTTLSQIIKLVEEASGSKAPIAKLADKISGIFVPTVIIIATITVIVWLILGETFEFAMSCGIAVLVISCPCALGLATPAAIMVGTGKGAENGILIKSAEALERAHETEIVVLDKTGTITEGKPKVTDIIELSDVNKNTLLSIAASLEKKSEHPLAEAIMKYADENNIEYKVVEDFKNEPGKGITGKIKGKQYFAGNFKLMKSYNVNNKNQMKIEELENTLANEGKTLLYFMRENEIIGIVAVADTIKSTSKEAIEEVKKMGIEVVMLTGDNAKTANAIKEKIGINKMISDVMPQDKEREIRNLQEGNHKVTMVGDGINDAPALKRADVGIAIGSGTDVAIESADIVLIKDDLLDGVAAIQLSKAVMRKIKQNLFWAFIYNILGIPLAAGVFYKIFGIKLSPMFGAAAMSVSSVSVVTNALSLKLFKPTFRKDKINKSVKNSKNDNNKYEEKIEKNLKEEKIMKKTMVIDGMMCAHCKGRVEEVLNKIDGVSAQVDLEKKSAFIELSKDVNDEVLKNAVTEAGYNVLEIK